MSISITTTYHTVIRHLVEERQGCPIIVEGTEDKDDEAVVSR